MQISFFEEFPTNRNLSKLKLVKWPTILYIAAKSIMEFNRIRSGIKNKKVKQIVYWPILKNKDGYWISPFSRRKALLKIFNELSEKKMPIMIDAELPTTRNPWLYFSEMFNFFRNKKLIRNFIYKHNAYVCEYCPEGRREAVLSLIGLHFKPVRFKIIKMLYHSMHHYTRHFIINTLKSGKKKYNKKYIAAFGTIAKGIHRNEPILSYKTLKQDLQVAKKAGVNEVIIYRLGGLNKKYAQIIEECL